MSVSAEGRPSNSALPNKVEVRVVSTGADVDLPPGDSVANRVNALISKHKVVLFVKSFCPFCLEAKKTFDDLGAPFAFYSIDSRPEGAEVHAALKAAYSHTTVPYVFINGDFVGGCDDTKLLHSQGKLEPKLKAAGLRLRGHKARLANVLGVLEGKGRMPSTLFSFPEVVDDRMARFYGMFMFITCLLSAIFYDTNQAHYVMLAVMCEYCVRFLSGGNTTPVGALAALCVALMELGGSRPKFVAGPPKQFASLCGLMFAALATLFFLCDEHEPKLEYVGLAFTCALGLATFLEGALGFCLGCYFFGWGVRLGLLPKEVYSVYSNSRPEAIYTWEELNKRLLEPAPERRVHHLLGSATPLAVDFKYKTKSDDHTKEDFHPIKHVKITHFLLHMGLAGAACAWKLAAPCQSPTAPWQPFTLCAPREVYFVTALVAAVLFKTWVVLYAAKCVMYPQKVLKEWMCDIRGNAFVVPLVNLVLFAYLVDDHSHVFAKVLFWCGAPAGLLLSLIKVGDWLAVKKDLEHVNPAWIIMPVSNFVHAFVGAVLDPSYRDACQFWFAFAFVMWLALFALTFFKAVLHKDEDDRLRPLLAVWVAAPAVMGPAYLALFAPVLTPAGFNDFIFINLNWFSVALALVLCWGFIRPFQGRIRFDMSYWAAGFPTAALSFTTSTYAAYKPGPLSHGIAIAALAVCSAVNVTLLLQTVAGIVRRRVFTPDYKWGPLSFMRLTHEAFRGALPRLQEAAEAAARGEAGAVEELREQWELMRLAHDEHSLHEDQVIFKAYNDFFPGLVKPWGDDHEGHHALMARADEALAAAAKGTTEGLEGLPALFREYCQELERHLRSEEDHLTGMPRKYIPLKQHKAIVAQCWELTPADKWFDFIPWALNSLPMLHQRVRFIKTFLWAMPERAQHIGLMVATGVDEVQWRRLTGELPELIPRGAPGWTKYG